jgi:hypothetical protein
MNTYAAQIALCFQSESAEDIRFEKFFLELETLAAKHGVVVCDSQSMRLPGAMYPIAPCSICGDLTVDANSVRAGDANMLPDFWFSLQRGTLSAGRLTCYLCKAPEGVS